MPWRRVAIGVASFIVLVGIAMTVSYISLRDVAVLRDGPATTEEAPGRGGDTSASTHRLQFVRASYLREPRRTTVARSNEIVVEEGDEVNCDWRYKTDLSKALVESWIVNVKDGQVVRDEELSRLHPLDPEKRLFQSSVEPTILRVLDEEGLTKAVIVRLAEQFSAGDSDKRGKQLDHVESWLTKVAKSLQLAGQISSKSFWAFYWSDDWYKWDFVARKPPDTADLEQPWNDLEKRIKSTSSGDLSTIPADSTHLTPRDHPLGAFCARKQSFT